MRRVIVVALLGLLVLPAVAGAATTGRVVVMLQERDGARAQASAAAAVAARAGARRAGPAVPEIGLVTLAPRAGSARALALELQADPAVRSAAVERRLQLRFVPNDPALASPETDTRVPAGTPVQWYLPRENLPRAWDFTRGVDAQVAIIDTGADSTHPEFRGKIRRAVDQGGGPAGADGSGHGTHVASLACAGTNDGVGMAGAGYDCELIVERSDLSESSIASSIVDATNSGADAINMSFGDDGSGSVSQPMLTAIDYAFDRGVLLVAAAADEPVEEQGQPANLLQPTGSGADVNAGKGLSVTAATFSDQRAGFAGRGSQISLAAYGAYGPGGPNGVFAAFPPFPTGIESDPFRPCVNCRTSFNDDNRYAYLQGTSMAAPQIAAIGAMVKRLNPDLRITELLRLLKQTARRPAGTGWGPELGWGIVDAGAAVEAARVIDRRPPSSRLRAPRRARRGQIIRLTWTAREATPPGLLPSGVRRTEVFASRNGGRFSRIARTSKTAFRFRPRAGSLYRFYTRAYDKAGNRESAPLRADASTRVSS